MIIQTNILVGILCILPVELYTFQVQLSDVEFKEGVDTL
jgi:hypothetical protein